MKLFLLAILSITLAMILLYTVGAIIEGFRQARGTVIENLRLLESTLQDLEESARELPEQEAQQLMSMLQAPRQEALECRYAITSHELNRQEEQQLRKRIRAALESLSTARSFAQKHSPKSDSEDQAD